MAKETKKRKGDNADGDEIGLSAKKRKLDVENAAAKYERQKKLAAERQRRYKERMSQEQLEKKRERDRERCRRLREEKKIKPIAEMKAAEQRKQRAQWKKYSATYRQKQKRLKDAMQNTPPESPQSGVHEPTPPSTQRKRGRKQVRRDRSRAYRKISKQAEEIKKLERKLAKYKKRLQREKNKKKNLTSPSPAKQVRDLVGSEKVSPNIKKRLFVGFALQKQLETQVKCVTPRGKERQLMTKAIGNKILKKYRVQHHLKKVVSYKYNKVQSVNENGHIDLNYSRKQYETVKVKEAQAIKNFFEDDANSKMCPGKNDFVRKGKQKMQRRILLNSMKNLYQKFTDETKIKISYATFARSRPYWVTVPKAKDRETCACMKHENFEFLIAALKQANVIKQNSSYEILKELVCSQSNEMCMLHECKKCKYKMIQFNLERDDNLKYFKWENIVEERTIKGKPKQIRRVVKKECYARASDIVEHLVSSLPLFKKHMYSLIHQARELKTLKSKLKKGEVLFHIDFSQNYVCKLSTEIQSMHFGASKKQISLHTVVRYHVEKEITTQSFCTASDNLDHHCHGVWAYLQPVLKQTADEFPDIESVHFFSDGPTSQYKNKGNVYLMKTLLPNFFKKLKSFTWNYSEPGHGKGAMDGIGGSVKRAADNFVKHGNDITCSSDLVKCLDGNNSSIKVVEIDDAEIQECKDLLPKKLPDISGIMQIRQFTYGENNMYGRRLSCFICKPSEKCAHYQVVELANEKTSNKQKRSKHDQQPKTTKKVLRVDEVYSSSDEELLDEEHITGSTADSTTKIPSEVTKESLVQGAFVVVSYENVRKRGNKSHNYVGIVQSPVGEDNELKILFMKRCAKDNSMFTTDESDVPYVSLNQIKSILPNPEIVLKGDRVFYKFENQIPL